MKFIKLIIAVVIVIALVLLVVLSNDKNHTQKLIDTNSGKTGDDPKKLDSNNPKKLEPKFGRYKDDTDSVQELNLQIANALKQLKREMSVISNKVTNNTNKQNTIALTIKAITDNNKSQELKKTYQPINVNKNDAISKVNSLVTGIQQNLGKNIGLQPFNIGGGTDNNNTQAEVIKPKLQANYIWVQGLKSATTTFVLDNNKPNTNLSDEDIFANAEANTTIPKYTIPKNAILTGVLVTEMLARIPVNGKVVDAYRFSVRITDKSLFASFKQHNLLKGMILSGIAQGDLLLNCAKGVLDSATFIFDDGTISQTDISNMAIVIDDYGKPCIKGELITNAPAYLGISTGLSALTTAADAYASAEQTTSSDASGNTTQSITGSAANFAKLNAVSGGASNVSDWLSSRAQSSFDVIQVPSGVKLKILTNASIHIDYDLNGRKLTYYSQQDQRYGQTLD